MINELVTAKKIRRVFMYANMFYLKIQRLTNTKRFRLQYKQRLSDRQNGKIYKDILNAVNNN